MKTRHMNLVFVFVFLTGCGDPTACDSSEAQDLVTEIASAKWGDGWRIAAQVQRPNPELADLYKKVENLRSTECDGQSLAFDEAEKLMNYDVDDPRAYGNLQYWSDVSAEAVEAVANQNCPVEEGNDYPSYTCVHSERQKWVEDQLLAPLRAKGEIGCEAKVTRAKLAIDKQVKESEDAYKKKFGNMVVSLSNIRVGGKAGNKNICAADIKANFSEIDYFLSGTAEFSLEKNTDGELYAEVLVR